MWRAAVVPALVHAVIGGYVAYALLRGAKSGARRALGAAFALFTAYSVLIGSGYASPDGVADVLFVCSVLAAGASSVLYAEFARRFVLGDHTTRASRWAVGAALAVGPLVLAAGLAALGPDDPRVLGALSAGILVPVATSLAIFALGVAQRRPGAPRFLGATLLPVVPVVWDVLQSFGLDVPGYTTARAISLLAFCFLTLSAYMDYGAEPMSLRHRLVASTLATVLAALATASDVALVALRGDVADAARLEDGIATSFAALTVVTSVGVLAAFPLFLRRTLFAPVEALAMGARRIQAGEDVRVETDRSDELGTVGSAFNHMVESLAASKSELEDKVRELERTNADIAALAAELRRQVIARSRQLQEALGLEASGALGLAAGDVVDGRYRVLRELGGGGMGVVYEVVRTADDVHLALKVMGFASSRNDMVRFAREAEIAATVEHRNVVSVLDVGMHKGLPFLVMELAPGGSLEDARPRFGDVAWALPILADVADALAELHRRGIVHRDLKPGNVLLAQGSDGPSARVTDFGIARHDVDALAATAQLGANDRANLTQGGIVGTIPYMAPESGKGGARVTAKVDVFALGLMGWELCTGSLPYAMPPVFEGLAGRALAPPPALPEQVPPSVRAVLVRCVAQAPDARPTATEIAVVLREARTPPTAAAG